jgi:hypothetical protein
MTKLSTKQKLMISHQGLALVVMACGLSGCFVGTFYQSGIEISPGASPSPSPTVGTGPEGGSGTVQPPQGFLRVSPVGLLGNDTTPTFQVFGVTSGDTVTLHKDPLCSLGIASAIASGTTIELTPGSALTEGTYEFRARTSNSNGTSACSATSISYTVDTTAPSVVVSAASPSILAFGSGVSFTVTYSDANGVAATNLTGTSITLSPNSGQGSCSQISVTNDSLTSKTVNVGDCLGKATLDLWIGFGTATDNAGNTAALKVEPGFLSLGKNLTALPADEPGFSGLPSNDIRALTWDEADSELWVASRSGITKLNASGTVLSHLTTKGGLTGNHIAGIWASGSKLYAPTWHAGGLISSSDNGATFTNQPGTPMNSFTFLNSVFSPDGGTTLYTGGQMGLSKSTDAGTNFSNILGTGIGSIAASGTYVLAGTSNESGIRFSSTSGGSFVTKDLTSGTLPSDTVNAVYIDSTSGPMFYTATASGLVESNSDFSVNTTRLLGTAVLDVVAEGNDIYAATAAGLQYSTDGGTTFSTLTTAQGLPSDQVKRLALPPSASATHKLFIGTDSGLSIQDLPLIPGATETNVSTTTGLTDADAQTIEVVETRIFVGTKLGLSASIDGGATFSNLGIAQGLGAGGITAAVHKIIGRVSGADVHLYVATDLGLYRSTDSGASFSQLSPTGIVNDQVFDVYADGTNILAGTETKGFFVSTDDGATFNQYNAAAEWGVDGFMGKQVISTTLVESRIYAGISPGGSGYVVSIPIGSLGGLWTKDTQLLTPNVLAKVGTTLYVGDNASAGVYLDTNSDGVLEGPTSLISGGASSDTVYDIHTDGDFVCFATANGVALARASAPTSPLFNFNNVQKAGSNSVRGCRVSAGQAFLATSGGVSVLK